MPFLFQPFLDRDQDQASVSPWGATAAKEGPKKKSLWERRVGSSFQFPTEEEGGRRASLAAHTIEQTAQKSGEEKWPRNKAGPRARGFTTIF